MDIFSLWLFSLLSLLNLNFCFMNNFHHNWRLIGNWILRHLAQHFEFYIAIPPETV